MSHDQDLKNWVIVVGHMIKKYFCVQYTNKPCTIKRSIKNVNYTVVRPNHGLHHGLRQSILSVKIANILVDDNPNHPMSQWILLEDNDFIFKLAMVAAFQRTGRQSEISKVDNPVLYEKYISDDVKNFSQQSRLYMDNFRSDEELQMFQNALLWPLYRSNKVPQCYVETILSLSHKADLRRMLKFDCQKILKMIDNDLKGYPTSTTERIWKISGEHLKATGDRDMVSQKDYSDKFYLMSSDPEKIVDNLCKGCWF